MTTVITAELLAMIKEQYQLQWQGTHGVIHWNRVFENGMRLAEQAGVNIRVIQLFSIFHDSQRKNERRDKGHGTRGAELAAELRGHLPVSDDEFTLLTTACELHTRAVTHENITVQACFDSDRLDLGRVGIMPDPQYLCTPLAKEEKIIEWAYTRSLHHELPDQPFAIEDSPEAGTMNKSKRKNMQRPGDS